MMLRDLKIKTAVYLRCWQEDFADLRNRQSRPITNETKEIIKSIKEKGFYVLRDYYNLEVCENLREEIETTLKKYPDFIDADDEDSDHRIWGIERVSNLAKDFHNDKKLLEIAESYLQAKVENYMTLGAKLIAREANKGSGGGWHRDSVYEKQIKAIIYLSDVSKSNGPFQYIKSSNNKASAAKIINLTENGNYKRFAESDLQKCLPNLQTLTGKAGDVVLTDTRGIHQGMPIKEGVRYALTNYYVAKHRYNEFDGIFRSLIKFS